MRGGWTKLHKGETCDETEDDEMGGLCNTVGNEERL